MNAMEQHIAHSALINIFSIPDITAPSWAIGKL